MSNYKLIEKIFYKFSLSTFVREASFDLEKLVFFKKSESIADDHIFITGLARAGTTILLEAIYKSEKFASLTYLNMPFLLAPNLWGKVKNNNKDQKRIERAHGDGIMISPSSPEAFEEVFWQTFNQYESNKNFYIYVNLILKYNNKDRYLSKNNQNIIRLETIQKIFPKSKLLIVFKDPINHASSLLRQHRSFIKLQKKDKFIKNYMDSIYHSEFGLSYKPLIEKNLLYKDFNNINHWLEQWYLVYSKTYEKHKNLVFIDGESLRPNSKSWDNICELLLLDQYNFKFKDTRKNISSTFNFDILLYNKCKIVYKKLQDISI